MRSSTYSLFFLLILLLSGCQTSGTTPLATTIAVPPSATPNLQATVDASVKATTQAQQTQDAAVKSTVAVVVQSTMAALPPTATPIATVEAITLSEEELAALIDQAASEAAAATTIAANSTNQAAADGSVTEEEVQTVEVYVQASEQALTYAEQLISEYTALYGAYGEETIATLNEIEQDLQAMATDIEEIATVVEQGSAQASAAADKLQEAATAAQAKANTVQTKAQELNKTLQAELETRAGEALNAPPTQVASDLPGTLNQLSDFATGVRDSLSDRKVTPEEMKHVAQLSSNARASLEKNGSPQLKALNGDIEQLTGQMARGQWPQANKGVKDFDKKLSERRR